MTSVSILIAITAATVLGDYFVKLATAESYGLGSSRFIVGALLYALPSIGWFFLMKNHSLAMIGVLYSASTIVLLAALGVFVFREHFGFRDFCGITLALASVGVMTKA